ncbi:hypothetical protein M2139_001061 [Enterococcus sp. PF1-24]|nr:hypothetical protein [Enterococcus sp. PFB1-1]MDH6401177.1 hypothetical protein [Enterococcus sp. PF1-24]
MFPQSYALSLTDLLYIASQGNLLAEENCLEPLSLIQQKRTKSNGWKIDYNYKYNGYIVFKNGRKDSEWLTYFYNWSLKENN